MYQFAETASKGEVEVTIMKVGEMQKMRKVLKNQLSSKKRKDGIL